MPKVYGSLTGIKARCRHYFTEGDIITIKSRCCNKYYPYYKYHSEFEKYTTKRWLEPSFSEKAVLCGVCKHELAINEYMMVEHCPDYQSRSNSHCKYHYYIYSEI